MSPNSSGRPVSLRIAPEQEWYGQPILMSDGLGLVLFGSGVAIQSESSRLAAFTAGAICYGLGSPLVHVVNAQPNKGIVSGALRFGMPAALAGLAHLISEAARSSREVRDIATIGAVANGMVVAILIDQIAFANRSVPRGDVVIALVPRYEFQQQLALISVGGTW